MSKATDLLLESDYDLLIENGDLVIGLSDEQHVALLLLTEKGEWRHDGLAGIGLQRQLSGPLGPTERAALQREISLQLERDGFIVRTVQVTAAGELTIDAERL